VQTDLRLNPTTTVAVQELLYCLVVSGWKTATVLPPLHRRLFR
jgi:hypothetical protein